MLADDLGASACGSIGDLRSVGRTTAPAARAASPVVLYIATWAGCAFARLHGPWSTSSIAATVTPATISAITAGNRAAPATITEFLHRAWSLRVLCRLPSREIPVRPPHDAPL